MAAFRFAEAINRGTSIDLYNSGRMLRDFTYIDDIVEGLVRVVDRPQSGHHVYNIGNSSTVGLMEFVHAMEKAFGKRARRRFMPLQAGDVLATHADVDAFCEYTGFRPATPVDEGVERFANWYRSLYGRTAPARVA
jgi:UDP-glucuronate 4-epimerase